MDVSILILTHKNSEYIDKAIQTSLNQKFNGEFEVILCSDGDISIKQYAEKYKIKFVLSKKTNNLTTCSFNVNEGVKQSKGKYIKILAYDDWLPENCLQDLHSEIIKKNYSAICANSNEISKNKTNMVKSANIVYTLDKLLEKNVIHGGTVLFKKQDFIDVGGYDINLKFAEEYDFHLRLLSKNKKIGYIDKLVHFYRRHENQKGSTSLNPQQKIEKKLYVETHIKSKYNKKVICGVATIKERVENLKLTVKSIINQVDKLIVYQNGYKEMFDFLKNPKIEVISSLDTKIDMGDAGKFFKVNFFKNSYYLSIDDDLIYPNNYVTDLINNLKKFDNKVIVSYHGRNMKKNAKSYYLDILESFRCLDDVNETKRVEFGGTGVMGFHTSFVKNLHFSFFSSPNMADVWVGKFAEDNNIPIIVLPHKKGWIKTSLDLKSKDTIHKKYQFNHENQNNVIQTMKLGGQNQLKKFKLIFLTCTWKRPEITKIFKEYLEEVQKKVSNQFEITNIVVDSEFTNQHLFEFSKNFIYKNYNNFPVSNKWNYGLSICQNLDFDYLFIIGSDDLVDENLLKKYYEFMTQGYQFIGIKDLYMYNKKDNKLFYWFGYDESTGRKNETIGLARCISKEVIKKLNFNLWDNGINKGLDGSMFRKIKKIPNIKSLSIEIKDSYFACDLKSDFNITKLNDYNSKYLNLVNDNHKFSIKLKTILKKEKNISIIIPTYSNVSFLKESINSIIKSVKNLYCEILIGIDNCVETLKYAQTNNFDSRIKFYFFDKNVGPYVVKNSLSQIAKSEILLFFDSDDIMSEKMIVDLLSLHKVKDMVKPKYVDFRENINNKDKKHQYGEGVFSIKKNIFLSINGFEPWRCAADSDIMGRLYKSGIKFDYTKEISFLRRVHKDSLTQKPETNYGSKLRREYVKLSKSKKGQIKLPNLVTEKFYEVHPNSVIPFSPPVEKVEIPVPVIIPSPIEKLKGLLKGNKPKGVDYEKINDTLKQQGIYNPNGIKEKPKIKQNNPIDRNKLIEIKKGSVTDSLRMNIPSKPNRRKDLPNIFSKKNKN